MTNDRPAAGPTFDLEERTARFGEAVIHFAKKIPQHSITMPLTSQLVRAATSVGACYCEADNAESKKDFRHKIAISRKEAKESRHWLRMVVAAVPELNSDARVLWTEAKELHLILSKIFHSS